LQENLGVVVVVVVDVVVGCRAQYWRPLDSPKRGMFFSYKRQEFVLLNVGFKLKTSGCCDSFSVKSKPSHFELTLQRAAQLSRNFSLPLCGQKTVCSKLFIASPWPGLQGNASAKDGMFTPDRTAPAACIVINSTAERILEIRESELG